MKLTNPTEWQLNSNFAVEVAGWSWKIEGDNYVCWYNGDGRFMGGRNDGEPWDGIPKFTQSADLVLPWLEKHTHESRAPCSLTRTDAGLWGAWIDQHYVWDKSLPRAIVVALLRAHGIEIEFTK